MKYKPNIVKYAEAKKAKKDASQKGGVRVLSIYFKACELYAASSRSADVSSVDVVNGSLICAEPEACAVSRLSARAVNTL